VSIATGMTKLFFFGDSAASSGDNMHEALSQPTFNTTGTYEVSSSSNETIWNKTRTVKFIKTFTSDDFSI
jgi:hypothetical protein